MSLPFLGDEIDPNLKQSTPYSESGYATIELEELSSSHTPSPPTPSPELILLNSSLSRLSSLRILNFFSHVLVEFARGQADFTNLENRLEQDYIVLIEEQKENEAETNKVEIEQLKYKAEHLDEFITPRFGYSLEHLDIIRSLPSLTDLSLGVPEGYSRYNLFPSLAQYFCDLNPLSHLVRLQLHDIQLESEICQLIATAVLGVPIAIAPIEEEEREEAKKDEEKEKEKKKKNLDERVREAIEWPSRLHSSVSFPYRILPGSEAESYMSTAPTPSLKFSSTSSSWEGEEESESESESEPVSNLLFGQVRHNRIRRGMHAAKQIRSSSSSSKPSSTFSSSSSSSSSRSTRLSSLTSLHLQHCGLTDIGLAYLACIPSLRKLSIGEHETVGSYRRS